MTSITLRRPPEFAFCPDQELLGIVRNPEAGEQAVQDLVGAGFTGEAIWVFSGEQDRTHAPMQHHGLAPVSGAMIFTRVKREDAARYQEALRCGYWGIAVYTPDRSARELARQVLRSHGASFINYYGQPPTKEGAHRAVSGRPFRRIGQHRV